MQAQTFLGKVSMEALKSMDEHINQWMQRNNVEPKMVSQAFGYERNHHHDMEEPVVITTVWY